MENPIALIKTHKKLAIGLGGALALLLGYTLMKKNSTTAVNQTAPNADVLSAIADEKAAEAQNTQNLGGAIAQGFNDQQTAETNNLATILGNQSDIAKQQAADAANYAQSILDSQAGNTQAIISNANQGFSVLQQGQESIAAGQSVLQQGEQSLASGQSQGFALLANSLSSLGSMSRETFAPPSASSGGSSVSFANPSGGAGGYGGLSDAGIQAAFTAKYGAAGAAAGWQKEHDAAVASGH